jgi:acetyltransferase-like isoleucine patch superfamily enzyme
MLLMVLVPASMRRTIAIKVFHWDIDQNARIGRSLIMVGHLSMGPGSNIGGFNMIRGLDEVRMGQGATIGTRNWVLAPPLSEQVFKRSPNRKPVLYMGDYTGITNGHHIDCSDRVEFFDYAVLAGFRSQVLTHSLDLVRDEFVTGPVEFGERSAVMSGCVLLSGTRVPARSIVSAGSVITTKLTKELTFYRGNPAEAVRELPANMKYFKRRPEDVERYLAH